MPKNNNALFVRHFAFGDVLLTTPFFRMLAQEDPEIQLDLYSKINSIYLPSSVFRRCISMDLNSLNRTIRKGYSNIYWFSYEFDRSLHILDGYSLSSGLFPKDKTLSWTVLPDEHVRAKVVLEGVKRPLIGFLPVCGNPLKSLSTAKTQQLINLVGERIGGTVAVFADRFIDVENCLNLTNRFASIRDFASVIEQCDVLITIDTGPFHIAQALGIPTVGLFGCTLPELLTTRPDKLQMVRLETLPCLGCYHRVTKGSYETPDCARGDNACMEMLPNEKLVQAVINALEQRDDKLLMNRIADYEARKDIKIAKHSENSNGITDTYKTYILKDELRFDRRWRRKIKAWWAN